MSTKLDQLNKLCNRACSISVAINHLVDVDCGNLEDLITKILNVERLDANDNGIGELMFNLEEHLDNARSTIKDIIDRAESAEL